MLRILACLLVFWSAASVAEARERRAFVVGVETYRELPALDTTLNDALGFEQVLKADLGFDHVTLNRGTTLLDFQVAFGGFVDSIQPGDDVVFVFSGHGWSDGSDNFLALGDALRNAGETVLKLTTVSLSSGIIDLLHEKQPGALIVIIDACRSNPFATVTKSLGKGLVRVPGREGSFIAFAAGAGQEALPRLPGETGPQLSLFTRHLLPRFKDANRPLARIFEETRTLVQKQAETIPHAQRPAVYTELPLDFCLSRQCTPAFNEEEALWLDIAARSDDLAVCDGYASYLAAYPSGRFAGHATLMARSDFCVRARLQSETLGNMTDAPPAPPCPDLQFTTYFEFDRTALKARDTAQLDEVARIVFSSSCPVDRVIIRGHDDVGYLSEDGTLVSAAYSVGVSDRRAQGVAQYLIASGVSAAILQTEAYGGARPLNPEGNDLLNARVEIIVQRAG